MLPGFATPPGTLRFTGRFPAPEAAGFYRDVQGLSVSSVGIGTYLGEMDDATDRRYVEAVQCALAGGVNFIDTSLNYRNQRSERSVGAALRQAVETGDVRRDEIVICTKAGYLVPDAVPVGRLSASDVVGGMHSMATAFLADQLERSRRNLGLESIDVFYLHNPETQLRYLGETEFYDRIRQAFVWLETAVTEGQIHYYGTATWEAYRHRQPSPEALSLDRLAGIAQEIAGQGHHFRFIQLPFNLAMPEAFANRANGESVLQAAARLGIGVIAGASLLQARLSRNLPEEIRSKLPGLETDAQRALQCARSTPGIAVALAGMSSLAHIRENLGLADRPPVNEEQYLSLYTGS
jgi:aryl-alcohol dehydrogenase-like predicted oxidoreductase